MKKKTNSILIVLVIAILLLVIGYASTTDLLKITTNASATINDENFIVKFDKDVTPSVSDTEKVTNAEITGDTEATMTVEGLSAVGDTATATFTVKNASLGIGATVSAVEKSNTNPTYFKVTPTVKTPNLAVNGSTEVEVKVELLKTPVEEEQTAEITVELTATSVQQ